MRAVPLLFFVVLLAGCLPHGGGGSDEPSPTPIGFAIGMPVTATIGPSGGMLASGDGQLTLVVPPGALATDTELSIGEVMSFAHGAIGATYQIAPEGTSFATPATLRFTIDETALVRGDAASLGVAFQSADGLWHWSSPSYDAATHTISTTTDHLSPWSLVEGVQLVPGGATVPEGASLGLAITGCYAVPAGSDGLAPLGYSCDEAGLAPLVDASEWAVNGVPGGDGVVGTIVASGHSATYQAPSHAPTPPLVRVSARISGGLYGGTVYVFANIAVGTPHPLDGTVTVRQPQNGVDFTVSYQVHLDIADDGVDETNWSATGTARLTPSEFLLNGATCVADMPEQAVDESEFLKVRKDPTLAVRFGGLTGWDFTCTDPSGSSFPWLVTVAGQTGRGTGCLAFDDAPITDIENIDTRYDATCSPLGPAQITWSLHRAD